MFIFIYTSWPHLTFHNLQHSLIVLQLILYCCDDPVHPQCSLKFYFILLLQRSQVHPLGNVDVYLSSSIHLLLHLFSHHSFYPALPPPHSLCSSSVTRWLTVSMPWLIFSCSPCVSFLMAWRSFSNIFIFRSSFPSRSSTLQVPFPRPGEPFDGALGAEEEGDAGRRPPGGCAAGEEEELPVGGAGALLPAGLLPLLPPDVSVRFKAAGPISACRRQSEIWYSNV